MVIHLSLLLYPGYCIIQEMRTMQFDADARPIAGVYTAVQRGYVRDSNTAASAEGHSNELSAGHGRR